MTNVYESLGPELDRPTELADLAMVGGYRVAAASVIGRGHAHQGRPRDDAFALVSNVSAECGWWFAAVSDGAGSRPLSRYSANAVTKAAASCARERLAAGPPSCEMMLAVVEAARATQREVATARGVDVGELSCTLLCIACSIEASRLVIVTFQIGDGLIAVCDPFGKLSPLAAADDDTPGRTLFLEMLEDPGPRIRLDELVEPPQGFLVATDGVADDLIPLAENGPILAQELQRVLVSAADAGERLAGVLAYEKRGSFDDRTLVVAWRGKAAACE